MERLAQAVLASQGRLAGMPSASIRVDPWPNLSMPANCRERQDQSSSQPAITPTASSTPSFDSEENTCTLKPSP